MKKELPKIAIKYSEENWKEIKKAVDYLRSKGICVEKRKGAKFTYRNLGKYYLRMCGIYNLFRYDIFYIAKKEDFTVLNMPQDLEKLKGYFEEPKIQYKTPAQAFDAKRLKDLEKENNKLKQANLILKECNDDLVSRIKRCCDGLD